MGGRYPTYSRPRAGLDFSDFRRNATDLSHSERVANRADELRLQRQEMQMRDLARRTAELDKLRGPVKMPTPPQLPLQARPAWALADEAMRMAQNPHWQRALSQARRNALRAAVAISPLGRIMTIFDLLNLASALGELYGVQRFKPGGVIIPPGYSLTRNCGKVGQTFIGGVNLVCEYGGQVATNSFGQVSITRGSVNHVVTFQTVDLNPNAPPPVPGNQWFIAKNAYQGVFPANRPYELPSFGIGRPKVNLDYNPDPLFQNAPAVHVRTQTQTRTRLELFTPRRAPRQGVIERKALSHGPVIRAIKRIVNGVAESMDAFNCAYEALPDDVKGYKPKPSKDGNPNITFGGEPAVIKPFRRQHTKAAILWENRDKIDLYKLLTCVVENQVEDRIIGTLAKQAGPFGGRYGRPIGFTSGPAL